MASLEVGIVGLPNVGKTSVFNALTGAGAEITGYAATRTSANVGVAAVPDARVAELADAVGSAEQIPATVGFADVSGLTRGAGAAEGLGGEFLGNLRATEALAHVVRCFEDETVFHPEGRVDPVADAETVDLELLLADAALAERRRERVARAARVGEAGARDELAALEALAAHLDAGEPARTLAGEVPGGLDLLTARPEIYVANVSEEGDAGRVQALTAYAAERRAEVVSVAARFEAELAEIDDLDERAEFLRDLGLEEPGMPRLARAAYRTLGLISFFTAGPKETRAWTVAEGATAVEAAGRIHSDIARGFIRAEVIDWRDLVECGSSAEARKRGVERVEGRDYVVRDGDVINVRFNV